MPATPFESSWQHRDFFPESIPHFLHQDLAYYWVLEARGGWRPKNWAERVEAWKYLFAAFLTADLDLLQEPITSPLATFSSGIDTVSWLVLPGSRQKVGVLSTTVVVRPLPDYEEGMLERWRQVVPDPLQARPEELGELVELAKRRLSQSASVFAHGLARILQDENFPSSLGKAASPHGQDFSLPYLHAIDWPSASLGRLELLRRDKTRPTERVYVPKCQRCGRALPRQMDHEPFELQEDNLVLSCLDPTCNAATRVPLESLFVWIRNREHVVVWGKSPELLKLTEGFPPKPALQGEEVLFDWNPAHLAGEQERRFLRLRFPGRSVEEVNPRSAFAERLLVLGEPAGFRGHPVLPEWLDSISSLGTIEMDDTACRVSWSAVGLRGLAAPIRLLYSGPSVVSLPSIRLGLFPSRKSLPASWKWFRAFVDGHNEGLELEVRSGRRVLATCVETTEGLPRFVTVSDPKQRAGATYILEDGRQPAGDTQRTLAVDFGTTHTVFYEGVAGQQIDPRPATHGIRPSDLAAQIEWLAPGEVNNDGAIGSFLPPSNYRMEGGVKDPYLFPSALWRTSQDEFVVRWSNQAPSRDSVALSSFKLDKPGEDMTGLRSAYLREVCLLVLPTVLAKAENHFRNSVGSIQLSVAFPLALNYQERDRFGGLLASLTSELTGLTGLEFLSPLSVSESSACVEAFGSFNPGDTFLVADMGGGTIDLALFSIQAGRPSMHQIGSVRFAGETFIRALAPPESHSGGNAGFWRLHDAISSSSGKPVSGVPLDSVHKFACLAFELLRTMIEAHRRATPQVQLIKLLLVGNGWRLASTLSPGAQARREPDVFRAFYEDLLGQMGCESIELYFPDLWQEIPSSKHLVAIGAVLNAESIRNWRHLGSAAELSRLPAGRGMSVRIGSSGEVLLGLKWENLVGDGIPISRFGGQDFDNLAIDFDLQDFPEPTSRWASVLLRVFSIGDLNQIPTLDEGKLREFVRRSIVRTAPYGVGTGPLQVLLEQRWPGCINSGGR